ncbi:MAG: serine/threonine protein kinase [Bacteroidota bacterium]
MITLNGRNQSYSFEESKPLARPGKFSVVYKGVGDDGNYYLIKRLNSIATANLFEKEVKHPAFVKTIEQINDGHLVYLIRPFIEGFPLSELKKINWFVTEKNVFVLKSIIQKICEALTSLHQQELVHLDIRPHNILVGNINNIDSLFVSIIDLDMVRPFNNNSKIVNFPLLYAAPELMLKSNLIIDHRTDIYALALTIYEIIFDALPFSVGNPELILHLMLNKQLANRNADHSLMKVLNKAANKTAFPLPPSQLNDLEIQNVLLSGMNSRYTSVEEFRMNLLREIKFQPKWYSRLFQFLNR